MHLALNMSHDVYGLLLIYPSGDISLMCYIGMSSSRGKWYLQTIRGFASTCLSIKFATHDRARKQNVFFFFCSGKSLYFYCFLIGNVIRYPKCTESEEHCHILILTSVLYAKCRQICIFFLVILHRLKCDRSSLRS